MEQEFVERRSVPRDPNIIYKKDFERYKTSVEKKFDDVKNDMKDAVGKFEHTFERFIEKSEDHQKDTTDAVMEIQINYAKMASTMDLIVKTLSGVTLTIVSFVGSQILALIMK